MGVAKAGVTTVMDDDDVDNASDDDADFAYEQDRTREMSAYDLALDAFHYARFLWPIQMKLLKNDDDADDVQCDKTDGVQWMMEDVWMINDEGWRMLDGRWWMVDAG